MAAYCRNCDWNNEFNLGEAEARVHNCIQYFDGETYNQFYLQQVEGAKQISIGHTELLTINSLYMDTHTIPNTSWKRYAKKVNTLSYKHAEDTVIKAKQKLDEFDPGIWMSIDANYPNGNRRKDSQNASMLFLAKQIGYQVIHYEVASSREGGNFKGKSTNMEAWMYHDGFRKLTNEGIDIENVGVDGDCSVERINPIISDICNVEAPILTGDANHWQLKRGSKLSSEMEKQLKELRDNYKKNSQEWIWYNELIKSCNTAWGKRICKRIIETLREIDGNGWTYDHFYEYISTTIVVHYCPRTEYHYDCTNNSNWWCISQDLDLKNWINTSDEPLPVDPSGKLQELLLNLLKEKILPLKKFDLLKNDLHTIKNEQHNGVVQKYCNKRKGLGSDCYKAQVQRSIPQINNPHKQHIDKIELLGVEISKGQLQIIEYLLYNYNRRNTQFHKQGNPYKLKKMKIFFKGDQILSIKDGYAKGVLWEH
eukprot:437496_1